MGNEPPPPDPTDPLVAKTEPPATILPHDEAAERAIVGSIMMRPENAETALTLITADDFYDRKVKNVFLAINDCWQHGHPLDAVSIGAALDRMGMPFLKAEMANMIAEVPQSRNIERYCTIVIDASARRKLIFIADDLMHASRSNQADATELLVAAREKLEQVDVETTTFLPEGLSTLDDFLDRPEADQADWVVPGLVRRGWRVLVVAGEGAGKAIDLDAVVPTPIGFSTMGALAVGDVVFDGDGCPTTVIAATEVMVGRPCYRVTFSDGEQIVADRDHLWVTVDYAGRQRGRWEPRARTTGELAATVIAREGSCLNHLVEASGALRLPAADLPLDPYLFGVWLGDGTSRNGQITSADPEVIDEIRGAGWECSRSSQPYGWIIHRQAIDDGKLEDARGLVASGTSERAAERAVGVGRGALARSGSRVRRSSRSSLASVLRRMGQIRNKHVPAEYLRASVSQREALLAGLLDAGGSAQRNSVELTLTDPVLVGGAVELIRSLGFRPSVRWSDASLGGRVVGRRCRIRFTPDRPVFRLARKQNVLSGSCHRRSLSRYVAAVEPVESVPVRCIQVANADGVFLVGASMVRTHNSVLLRQIAISAAAGLHPLTHRPMTPIRVLVIDAENPDEAVEEVCAPMRIEAENRGGWDPDRCWLWRDQSGINLLRRRGRVELEAVIRASQPDLVCLGPMYKTFIAKSQAEEEAAVGEVQAILDDLRTRYGFGLLMEHHAPHGESNRRREIRPHGSVRWQRWPELGIALLPVKDQADALELGRFRGDRVKNTWPEKLERSGGAWPWEGTWATGHFDPDDPEDDNPKW